MGKGKHRRSSELLPVWFQTAAIKRVYRKANVSSLLGDGLAFSLKKEKKKKATSVKHDKAKGNKMRTPGVHNLLSKSSLHLSPIPFKYLGSALFPELSPLLPAQLQLTGPEISRPCPSPTV